MKKLLIMTIVAVLAAPGGFAGGLSPPLEESPRPTARPTPDTGSLFAGAYVGAMFSNHETETKRQTATSSMTETPITDSCIFGNGHSGGQKCDDVPSHVVADQFGELPRCGRNYSRNCIVSDNGDGTFRVFVKGAEAGDALEWNTGETEIEYGETIFQSITDAVSNGEAGVFAGYRVDIGVIAGVEVSTDAQMSTLEASIGYDFGNVLAYGFGGVADLDGQGGTVAGLGADMMIGENWLVGVKGTVGDFEKITTETIGLRVAYKF